MSYICATCNEPITGPGIVHGIQEGKSWHNECPNPMSGVFAALDEFKQTEAGQ